MNLSKELKPWGKNGNKGMGEKKKGRKQGADTRGEGGGGGFLVGGGVFLFG